jgi:diguanylate cyclase (GGDEF)-like protein
MNPAKSDRLRLTIYRNTLSSLIAYQVPFIFGYLAVWLGVARYSFGDMHVIYLALLGLVASFLLVTRFWPAITSVFADRMLLVQIAGWTTFYIAWLITLNDLRGFGLIGAVVVFTHLFAYGSLWHSIFLIILFSILHLTICYVAIHVLGQSGNMRWEFLFFFQFPLVYLFMARLGHRMVAQTRALIKSKTDLELAQHKLESAMTRLNQLATTDPLTGLLNRRAIDEELCRLKELAQRNNSTFSLILADIDHFKDINDEHGHDVGDDVLKEVATRLTQMVRKSDRVARWGGEEFLVVLSNTRITGAMEFGHKMLQQISVPMRIDHLDLDLIITVSIGIVDVTGNDDIALQVKKADVYLYRAKKAGRNRLETSASQPPSPITDLSSSGAGHC